MRYLVLIVLSVFSVASSAADAPARLDWSERVAMSTLVSGVVDSVNVRIGDQVRKGDVLLTLDQSVFAAALDKATKTEQSAKLAMLEAQKEYERAQELYERTVLSDHELATANVLNVTAEAEYHKATAALALARQQQRFSQVVAPFDGVVVQVAAVRGQTVVTQLQSVPLVTLGNNRPMLARAMISENQMSEINKNSPVSVKVNGKQYKATVFALGMEANTEGEYELAVSFVPASVLRQGQKAEIVLP